MRQSFLALLTDREACADGARSSSHAARTLALVLVCMLLVMLQPPRAYAQGTVFNVLDATRAIDWSTTAPGAGVIPARATNCINWWSGASTPSSGTGSNGDYYWDTGSSAMYLKSAGSWATDGHTLTADLNTSVSGCASGQTVFMNTGTYTVNAGVHGASNVTLRGAGPLLTFLKFTGSDSCSGLPADICVEQSGALYDGSAATQPGGANACQWTAGYAQGATSLTFTTCGTNIASVAPGSLLMLDQANESTDNGGYLNCVAQAVPCTTNANDTNAFGRVISGVQYSQIQVVKVTGISHVGGTYTVTITPGLYSPSWRTGQTPGAWWSNTGGTPMTSFGVENMTIDHLVSQPVSGISFYDAYNCWSKNVRSLFSSRNHVGLIQAAHISIIDGYYFGSSHQTQGGNYGVEPGEASDGLVQNDIFDQVGSPVVFSNGSGWVVGYTVGQYPVLSNLNDMLAVVTSHDTGNHMNLFEGNQWNGISQDNPHGGGMATTMFRNRLVGQDSPLVPKSTGTFPINFEPLNRINNIVGNVLGLSGYHNTYETYPPSNSTGCNTSIYQIGWSTEGCTTGGTIPNDTVVRNTLMRWGNYDVVNAAVRWDNTESSPASVAFVNANSTPGSHTLAASWYLASKPSFFNTAYGNVPYPAIGPDVTSGTIANVGGFANNIPAQLCVANTAISTYSQYTGATASWSGGTATITVAATEVLAGSMVNLTGFSNTGYNSSLIEVASVTGTPVTSFTVTMSNPGSTATGGIVTLPILAFDANVCYTASASLSGKAMGGPVSRGGPVVGH